MINYNSLLKNQPFEFDKNKKKKFFYYNQKKLTTHHLKNCEEYKKLSNFFIPNLDKKKNISNLPFVHAQLFKNYNLLSKSNFAGLTMNSSGTTGKVKSKINLDFQTSIIQSKVLKKIIFDFIPNIIDTIVIIDNKNNFISRQNFDAKKAAIRGFAQFFKNKIFLLNDKNNIDFNKIKTLSKNKSKPILFFGFTSVVYDKFLKNLIKKNIKLSQKNSFFLHGGGWKKLENRALNKTKFNKLIQKYVGSKKVYNYYGMVEQTGSIFMECEYGNFHTSIFSEIIIRDKNLSIEKNNTKGIVQVFSLLPVSYPGHNILTEDLGTILGEDDCKCKRKGKYFKIDGRIKSTEIRGCSDAS